MALNRVLPSPSRTTKSRAATPRIRGSESCKTAASNGAAARKAAGETRPARTIARATAPDSSGGASRNATNSRGNKSGASAPTCPSAPNSACHR